jgi:hypothetical protein
MKIIATVITLDELNQMATEMFGNMVKAVVDIEQRLLAVDAELHSDLESALLETGSQQKNLWGINLYPKLPATEFIEYDSLINIRPSQNNNSRNVEDTTLRQRIREIVSQRILK